MQDKLIPGSRARDLTGLTFNRLTVVEHLGTANKQRQWKCRCSCGRETVASSSHLRQGLKQSCGCLSREILIARNRTHGLSHNRLYDVWWALVQRCTNPQDKKWEHYGGRGITVCAEWRQSPEAFIRDMGPTYETGLTIDRIDVNGNYEPGNCKWATYLEQNNNTRRNRRIAFRGVSKTVSEWARALHVSEHALRYRISAGWDLDRALTTGADPQALARFLAEVERVDS